MAKKVPTGLGALVLVAVTAAHAYWPAEARAYRSAWRRTVDSRSVDTPQARLDCADRLNPLLSSFLRGAA
jgi:hypothetical protein